MSADSRRLVRDVLLEAARGDDPALAEAARAELRARHLEDRQRLTAALSEFGDSIATRFAAIRDSLTPTVEAWARQLRALEAAGMLPPPQEDDRAR